MSVKIIYFVHGTTYDNASGTGSDTYEYPSHANLLKIMEEEILIDSFFDSTFLTMQHDSANQALINALKDTSLKMIPNNITDFVSQKNPYKDILDSDSIIKVDNIMFILGMRMIEHFIYEKRSNVTPEEWGKLEAYNFWRYNRVLSKDIIDKISSDSFSKENFIGFLANTDKTYINDKPCYQFNSGSTSLIKVTATKHVEPSGTYNVPASVSSYNGFIQDASNGAIGLWNFPLGQTRIDGAQIRPTEYIRLFDDFSYLREWSSDISVCNLSEYCDKEKKSSFIESQLLPIK